MCNPKCCSLPQPVERTGNGKLCQKCETPRTIIDRQIFGGDPVEQVARFFQENCAFDSGLKINCPCRSGSTLQRCEKSRPFAWRADRKLQVKAKVLFRRRG